MKRTVYSDTMRNLYTDCGPTANQISQITCTCTHTCRYGLCFWSNMIAIKEKN